MSTYHTPLIANALYITLILTWKFYFRDMLDTKQMLPRVVGGSLVMFLTIAIVALFAYHVLESGGNPEAPSHTVKPPAEALKTPKAYTHHAKALHRIHTRGRVARKRHDSPTSWMESIVDGRPHENSVNQRRLLSLLDENF